MSNAEFTISDKLKLLTLDANNCLLFICISISLANILCKYLVSTLSWIAHIHGTSTTKVGHLATHLTTVGWKKEGPPSPGPGLLISNIIKKNSVTSSYGSLSLHIGLESASVIAFPILVAWSPGIFSVIPPKTSNKSLKKRSWSKQCFGKGTISKWCAFKCTMCQHPGTYSRKTFNGPITLCEGSSPSGAETSGWLCDVRDTRPSPPLSIQLCGSTPSLVHRYIWSICIHVTAQSIFMNNVPTHHTAQEIQLPLFQKSVLSDSKLLTNEK